MPKRIARASAYALLIWIATFIVISIFYIKNQPTLTIYYLATLVVPYLVGR